MQAICHETMLPSLTSTRSAPRNWTRFAAQYSARGRPCERFTAVLADRTSCITRGRGGWLDLTREGLSPPVLCQLSWRTPVWVICADLPTHRSPPLYSQLRTRSDTFDHGGQATVTTIGCPEPTGAAPRKFTPA